MNFSIFEDANHLYSTRLSLRPLELSDGEAILKIYSDPKVIALVDMQPFERIEQAIDFINNLAQQYQDKQVIYWGMNLNETDQIVGVIGFEDFDTIDNRCSLRCDLLSSYWQQGLTTEAMKEVIWFGFEQIEFGQIEAITALRSPFTLKILQKAGFQEAGVSLQHYYNTQETQELQIYALTKN